MLISGKTELRWQGDLVFFMEDTVQFQRLSCLCNIANTNLGYNWH